MLRYVVKRLVYMFVTLFVIVTLTWFMSQLLPGTPFADGSLRSDFSPISIRGRGLHRGRGAILREPLSGRHSQAIFGPAGIIQGMYLDDTDTGREVFSKVKALLKKVAARTREALVEGMGWALKAVTERDAAVRPLWLPAHRSTIMRTAVGGRDGRMVRLRELTRLGTAATFGLS
jgi:hypothetical protein